MENEREREDLYVEWIEEQGRKRHESIKAEERKHKAALLSLLSQSSPWATAETPWRRAQEILEESDSYQKLGKVARLEVWQEHMRDLESQEEATEEKGREEQRCLERLRRAAFRKLLEQHRREGKIQASTRWKVREFVYLKSLLATFSF